MRKAIFQMTGCFFLAVFLYILWVHFIFQLNVSENIPFRNRSIVLFVVNF